MTVGREIKHWPEYTTPNEPAYAIKHVSVLFRTLSVCKKFRTAIQAGGSIGYWPLYLSKKFKNVITFEPEPLMRDCLIKNLRSTSVEVRPEALGSRIGKCGLQLSGFGSHHVVEGDVIEVITIDSLDLSDVDFIQLDVEGYELQALNGGFKTIVRCSPVIQVEILQGDTDKERKEEDLRMFLTALGYHETLVVGRDHVFSR